MANSLDDLKYIHERDSLDALGIAAKQPPMLLHDFGDKLTPQMAVKNVVLAGMGGSAFPAAYILSWPGLKVPFEISRGYDLPPYVGNETLVIVSSYSGNTEETLSALNRAEQAGAQIVVVSAGGKLAAQAQAAQHPLLVLPPTAQPRYATFSIFKALLSILHDYSLTVVDDVESPLKSSSDFLQTALADWLPTVPTARNPAKQLALELMGKSIVIYAGPLLAPVANKWKISFNENAKNIAWWNQYPEFNHNEFIGWSSHPVQKPYAVVDLHSSLDNAQIKKRFEISQQLLSGQRPVPEVVEAIGADALQQLLWTSIFGDFVSLYVALLNGLDPGPVDLVEKLKKLLG